MDSPSVTEYLRAFKASKTLGKLIVYCHTEEGQDARFARLSRPLPGPLAKALDRVGLGSLYTHQAQAIDLVRDGRHVVVATPTASGKSLIYNIPILERAIVEPWATALYLFPLKALAQDQLSVLGRLSAPIQGVKVTSAIYDGDTTSYRRGKIRANPPNCLFTNPDMLHLSLLPYHDRWANFWRNLKFVVVDEVHSYRGIMGSNMGWVFRRLIRICERYGSRPTFILSSATVGNPLELSRQLTGLEFHGVTKSGAPKGRRHLLLVDPQGAGAAQTAVQLILAALKRGLRTICYTQSRKLTELVSLWVGQRAGSLAGKVSAYRAGFLPEERRLVEKQLSDGELLAVISTSALELGIDIGLLDLCVLVGYPGTLMSLRQRGGRVGRSSRESAVIMVAGEDALDRYFLNNPKELVERPTEKAVVNVTNPRVVEKHLVCAASEAPIGLDEPLLKDEGVRSLARGLLDRGRLFLSGDGASLMSLRKYPQREVDLRGAGKAYQIVNVENGTTIGSVDGYRVFRELHPGAIYLHRGESFQVTRLDIEGRRAEVRPVKVDYFTRVRSSKETEIIQVVKNKELFG
ncbi:MAG: DEAD/DEAH box helicase, partial [Thermodesulfobacteria bacterium]|nr:DEAD/DEAH box helicase [Thermodesulfobacteriota bacterium]